MEILRFLYIGLCFFISILSFSRCLSKRDYVWLITAMLFTLISDYSLLISNNETLGVATFCLVHVSYLLRFHNQPHLKEKLILLSTIFLASLIFGELKLSFVFLYAALLFLSLSSAYRVYKLKTYPPFNRKLIFCGMILFFLCDFCVFLYQLQNYLQNFHFNIEIVSSFAVLFIWVFYTPAQLLLSISGYRYNTIKDGSESL